MEWIPTAARRWRVMLRRTALGSSDNVCACTLPGALCVCVCGCGSQIRAPNDSAILSGVTPMGKQTSCCGNSSSAAWFEPSAHSGAMGTEATHTDLVFYLQSNTTYFDLQRFSEAECNTSTLNNFKQVQPLENILCSQGYLEERTWRTVATL